MCQQNSGQASESGVHSCWEDEAPALLAGLGPVQWGLAESSLHWQPVSGGVQVPDLGAAVSRRPVQWCGWGDRESVRKDGGQWAEQPCFVLRLLQSFCASGKILKWESSRAGLKGCSELVFFFFGRLGCVRHFTQKKSIYWVGVPGVDPKPKFGIEINKRLKFLTPISFSKMCRIKFWINFGFGFWFGSTPGTQT